MEIKQQLEALKKEFNEMIEVIMNDSPVQTEPKFKIGDYVRIVNGGNGAFCANGVIGKIRDRPTISEAEGNLSGLLITDSGPFIHGICGRIYHVNLDSPMVKLSHEEILSALSKEAIKRGFKEGATVKNTIGVVGVIGDRFNIDFTEYAPNIDRLIYKGVYAYEQGKWAEVLKDEPIKIGGYEVVIHPRAKQTTIDLHEFSLEFWQAAKTISEHSKAKIMVGCTCQYDVTIDTINAILNKLK